ncbi:hypothetical protein AGMMS50239_06320 [Bacteroidia bacterium]|nr:hypothetical protein AGMMS50239_06320 [Bacteroidia bacterium]
MYNEEKIYSTSKIVVILNVIQIIYGYNHLTEMKYNASFVKDYAWRLFLSEHYEEAKQKAKEILNKKIKIDHPKIDRMKREMQAILNEDSTIN